jgi:hypothetical protein
LANGALEYPASLFVDSRRLDHFNDEKERYRDNGNHVLSGHSLSLVAKRGESDLFESGMIRTHRTFYYGYFEARVRFPNARGVWPAFWLVGDYDQDGKTSHPPEIDIFEYVINGVEDKENMLHSGPHELGQEGGENYTYVHPNFSLKHKELYARSPLNQGYHIAGMVWSPTKLSFFLDGEHIYSRDYKWVRSDGRLGPPAQLVLNFAVGGAWAGRHGIDEDAFPQALEIDYVRVCQFTNSSTGSERCGGSEATPSQSVFGYSAPFGDMAKPTFGRPRGVILGQAIEAGFAKVSQSPEPFQVTIPVELPTDYPMNRILDIYLVDEKSGAQLKRQRYLLINVVTDNQNRQLTLTLGPLKHPGSYRLEAQILADIENEQGKHEQQLVPLACDTGVMQPPKARKCSLLIIKVGD